MKYITVSSLVTFGGKKKQENTNIQAKTGVVFSLTRK